ncbi:MAG: ATP-binding cassette domain-containing protein [Planctomycetes bacterium]|nr:ATP-binding cassette domain-containing protein [Planctomycetota bacterium]MBL7187370.1 ATP-binding cassette domain-containing protein [Phycisphaerae bacterium]
MDAVAINDVCKSFGEVRAVSSLNVTAPAGSIYGFLGPNGAGKTTTIRMIMNIMRPDSGQIVLFGDHSVERAKSRIGYMPEERGLYRKMTVRKVLTYFGAIKDVTAADLARRVPQWLERMDLAKWADKKVEELSRGMHQKLQFAVTAINEPELLILDEPFSGLDPLNTDLLRSIILEMRKEGKTVIFSTHVMHEAEKLCDSILLINKGRAILDDSLANVRAQKSSHVVCAELEGDTDFVSGLANVTEVRSEGNRLEITLKESADSQELLRSLMERTRVRAFELKVPSLHEIFVDLVGKSDAEDS